MANRPPRLAPWSFKLSTAWSTEASTWSRRRSPVGDGIVGQASARGSVIAVAATKTGGAVVLLGETAQGGEQLAEKDLTHDHLREE